MPAVTSVYRWEGAVETADEHLLLVESTAAAFEAIRDRVRSEPPVTRPEVLAVPVVAVDARYAAWPTRRSTRETGTPSSTEDHRADDDGVAPTPDGPATERAADMAPDDRPARPRGRGRRRAARPRAARPRRAWC